MADRGGPPGLQTKAGPVRLDPTRKDEAPETLPEADPGEAHAADVMSAAQRMNAVPSTQGEVAEAEEGGELTLEEFQRKQDELFMENYPDLDVNQLITAGFLTHTVKIGENFEVQIRTITEDENSAIEQELSNMVGKEEAMARTHMASEVRRHILARSIMSMGGESFGDKPDDKYRRLGTLASPLTMLLHQEYRKLNKAASLLLTGSSGNSLERLLIGDEPL
jgi:hypothetical protein